MQQSKTVVAQFHWCCTVHLKVSRSCRSPLLLALSLAGGIQPKRLRVEPLSSPHFARGRGSEMLCCAWSRKDVTILATSPRFLEYEDLLKHPEHRVAPWLDRRSS